jgi:multidrug resistance efflux pump
LLAGLGVLLLAASFVGAGLAWRSRASAGGPPDAAPAPTAGKRAIVFGFVDAPAGLTNLYPVQHGRVVEVLVKEGDAVERGMPLYRLDDTQAKDKVKQAQAAVEEAQVKVAQARELVVQHPFLVKAKSEEIEGLRAQLETAKVLNEEAQDLIKMSKGAKWEANKAAAYVQQLEHGIKAKENELEIVKATDPGKKVEEAQAAVRRLQAQLEEAELGLRECTVTAQAKGTILQLNVTEGEVIGTTLLSPTQMPRHPVVFCPAGPRVIRAEVNQEWANRVAVGQNALVQDDSSAATTWRGRVTRLSDWYTRRRSTVLEPLQFNDVRTLEALIELEPNQPPVRIGQRMLVTLEGAQ